MRNARTKFDFFVGGFRKWIQSDLERTVWISCEKFGFCNVTIWGTRWGYVWRTKFHWTSRLSGKPIVPNHQLHLHFRPIFRSIACEPVFEAYHWKTSTVKTWNWRRYWYKFKSGIPRPSKVYLCVSSPFFYYKIDKRKMGANVFHIKIVDLNFYIMYT